LGRPRKDEIVGDPSFRTGVRALPDDKPNDTRARKDRKRDYAFLLMFPNTLVVVVIGIAIPTIALVLVLILGLLGLLH
jgi:hypothetical protein